MTLPPALGTAVLFCDAWQHKHVCADSGEFRLMVRACDCGDNNQDLAHVISESMVVSLCDSVVCVNMNMLTWYSSVDKQGGISQASICLVHIICQACSPQHDLLCHLLVLQHIRIWWIILTCLLATAKIRDGTFIL